MGSSVSKRKTKVGSVTIIYKQIKNVFLFFSFLPDQLLHPVWHKSKTPCVRFATQFICTNVRSVNAQPVASPRI